MWGPAGPVSALPPYLDLSPSVPYRFPLVHVKKPKRNEVPDVTLKKKKDSLGERRMKEKTSQYQFFELGLGVIRG